MLLKFDFSSGEYSAVEENQNPFLHVDYDSGKGQLVVTQDAFGTGVPVYVAVKDNGLYLCDSLVRLKIALRMNFELNHDVLPYFIRFGFVPGEKTLVREVRKLPPMKKLVATRGGGIEFLDIPSFETDETEVGTGTQDLETYYEETMEFAVRAALSEQSGSTVCGIALSGGFDSNMLLHLVKKVAPRTDFLALSVGGITGENETGIASKITKSYENVSFSKALVTQKTLKHLDDIVFRLEGCAYERGIFLQYELAKLAAQHGCKKLMLGECADQVFNEKTWSPVRDEVAFAVPYNFSFLDHPYQMASYVVLVKNAVMMKSFGIECLYPYLNKDVLRMAVHTKKENGTSKDFHKRQCFRLLPKEIGEKLSKKGGSTDLSPLFNWWFNANAALKKCKFYHPEFELAKRFKPAEAKKDYYLTLKYLESFERQFCDNSWHENEAVILDAIK